MTRNLTLGTIALVLAGTAGFAQGYHPDHAVVDSNYSAVTESNLTVASRSSAAVGGEIVRAGSNIENGGNEVQKPYLIKSDVTGEVSAKDLF